MLKKKQVIITDPQTKNERLVNIIHGRKRSNYRGVEFTMQVEPSGYIIGETWGVTTFFPFPHFFFSLLSYFSTVCFNKVEDIHSLNAHISGRNNLRSSPGNDWVNARCERNFRSRWQPLLLLQRPPLPPASHAPWMPAVKLLTIILSMNHDDMKIVDCVASCYESQPYQSGKYCVTGSRLSGRI